ncbi:GFA family protein [Roseibium sp. SCP14]|uniref:GFA family protein n=1 Tax=Roseibium sp. SCP14 TaxID=3141375 RepID=UPI0033392E6D
MSGEETSRTVPLPITGSCHCGAVSYEMKVQPRFAVECNCSICRSLGTVWGHGEAGDIEVTSTPEATLAYSRGDMELAFHTCKTCGSTTHWEAIAGEARGRMAVNLRLAEPGTIETIGHRHFDGADTWTFLD